MAIFKCKMCGSVFEVQEDQTTATCDYCGTRQTLPRLSSDRRANLYDRANRFRRDNEYDKAAGIYEQILNEDATDAEAYVGKLMAELQCPRREALQDCAEPFDELDSYKKALRFGDEGLRAELQGAVAAIRKRNEQARLATAYDAARELMRAAKTAKDYQAAAQEFACLPGFRDADALAAKCQERSAALKRRRRRRPALAVAIVAVVAVVAAAIVLLGPKAVSALRYHSAEKLLEAGQYEDAMAAFEALDTYGDAADRILECQYAMAKDLAKEGRSAEAAMAFGKAAGYRDAWERSAALWEDIVPRASLSVGNGHIIGLRKDGTAVAVVAAGWYDNRPRGIAGWTDIVAVAAGYNHTVGLRADGTAIATGTNLDGESNVSGWTDLVAVDAEWAHTVGLRADGTVLATGWNDNGQCDVSGWKDIVAVAAGFDHTVGLRKDGTVIATGNNDTGQCDVSGWTDVVAIDAGISYTVGLRKDGTVLTAGWYDWYDNDQRSVADWSDIVAVGAGFSDIVGLRKDGTVIVVGDKNYDTDVIAAWTDIRLP